MALFLAKYIDAESEESSISDDGSLPSLLLAIDSNPLKILHESIAASRKKISVDLPELIHKRLTAPPENIKWPEEVMHVLQGLEYDVEGSITQLKLEQGKISLAEEKRYQDEKILRRTLVQEVHAFLREAERVLPVLHSVDTELGSLLAELENLESDPIVKKGKFVEQVLRGVQLTEWLRKVDIDGIISGIEFESTLTTIQELTSIISSYPLNTNSRKVISNRFNIALKRITDAMELRLTELKDIPQVYAFLKNFSNPKHSLEEIILRPVIKKFNYLFVRKESALNVLEHPEWPLRRVLEICKETVGKVGETDGKIPIFLANFARKYFTTHRWAQINLPEDQDLFAHYLGAYLVSANQWRAEYGLDALHAFLADILDDAAFSNQNDQGLLSAWIEFDRSYCERVMKNVQNPFDTSKFNPNVCNLVQTLLDLFATSNTRLELLKLFPDTFGHFVQNCHDNVVRAHLMHPVRIHLGSKQAMSNEERSLLKNGLEDVHAYAATTALLSESVRIHLISLIEQVDS